MEETNKNGPDRNESLLAGKSRRGLRKIQVAFAETFGLGPAVTISAIIFSALVLIAAVFSFFYFAPPSTIVLTSGDEGSIFQTNAQKYAKILAQKGVTLKILTSKGSLENLKRLADPKFHVDVGFVQAGMATGQKIDNLVSLGSISYEPLYLFCRADKPFKLLSDFSGKRLAVGEEGTGTNVLALTLLALNGIKPGGPTTLLAIDDEKAENELLKSEIDGAFMMGDSASSRTMRDLLNKPGITAFNFTQADAYARRIKYLNKLTLLEGSIDFGKNIPDHNINLLSPTVELVARADLHPALSDLLLEAATAVHSRAGRYQRQGEFPAPLEHEYPVSSDAQRFYKSGKSFLYRYLPFQIASLFNRILVVIVPLILILIPGLKSIPGIYRWRMRLRMLRWYRALLVLEGQLGQNVTAEKRQELLGRLDHIEEAVNKMKVPASFADQFYSLRSHVGIVRTRLTNTAL
jgi:hypothetical protein